MNFVFPTFVSNADVKGFTGFKYGNVPHPLKIRLEQCERENYEIWSVAMAPNNGWIVKKFNLKNVVLDPVMVAQSGDSLVRDDAIDAYKEFLIPLATVFTPNLSEAEALLGYELVKLRNMEKAAKDFAAFAGPFAGLWECQCAPLGADPYRGGFSNFGDLFGR